MALRVGIMGGTFDPIHHGHLVAAIEVQALFGLDEVDLRAHRRAVAEVRARVSPAEHRYLMAVIATASNPRFWVSRVDIDRARADLHDRHDPRHRARSGPGAELFFITGADALGQILSWRDADEALKLARFVGVTRPGYELTDAHLPVDSVTLLDVPAMAISSSDCRDRVQAGHPIWYLVPDGVVQYINKHRLYRDAP